jgi:hypothetical protein
VYIHHHHQHWHDSSLWALSFLRIIRHLPYCRSIWLLVWISEQLDFYGVRLFASRPTPNLVDQCIPLCLAPTPWLLRPGWPYQ